MIFDIITTFLFLGIVLYFLWRFHRKEDKVSLWVSAVLLLISGGIWVYLLETVYIIRPTVWLENVLDPFIPVPRGEG